MAKSKPKESQDSRLMPKATKKYVVYPGEVRSLIDGDKHFINAAQLIMLYKVAYSECVIAPRDLRGWVVPVGLISLYPRSDGKYELPKAKK